MRPGYRGIIARPTRREVLCGLAQAGVAASFAFDGATAAQSDLASLPFDLRIATNSNRTVLAHWHFFPISIDNKPPENDYYANNYLVPDGENGKFAHRGGYFRERPLPRAKIVGADWVRRDLLTDIELANKIGINAFQYNLTNLDPASGSWQRLNDLLEACRVSGTSLRIMPCMDCTSANAAAMQNNMFELLSPLLAHDCIFRDRHGRIVLSFFLPERFSFTTWSSMTRRLPQSYPNVSLFFIFLAWEQALDRQDLLEMADYVSIWSGDHRDSLGTLDQVARAVRRRGKQWIAPVWTQDFRPKDGTFVEARNSELFREAWRRVIGNGYEFVNLLTWNDYSEGSELRPSSSIRYSFYDLAAYFIQWFKTGAAPPIVRDVVYYFHRIHIIDKTKLLRQPEPFKTPYGPPPSNDIEALSFLVKGGRVEIEIGSTTTGFEAKAGLSSFRVPAQTGRPVFRLIRDGKMIISFASDFDIVGSSDFQDLLYHGGSSDRFF